MPHNNLSLFHQLFQLLLSKKLQFQWHHRIKRIRSVLRSQIIGLLKYYRHHHQSQMLFNLPNALTTSKHHLPSYHHLLKPASKTSTWEPTFKTCFKTAVYSKRRIMSNLVLVMLALCKECSWLKLYTQIQVVKWRQAKMYHSAKLQRPIRLKLLYFSKRKHKMVRIRIVQYRLLFSRQLKKWLV